MMNPDLQSKYRCGCKVAITKSYANVSYGATPGAVSSAGQGRTSKFTINGFAAILVRIPKKISLRYAQIAIRLRITHHNATMLNPTRPIDELLAGHSLKLKRRIDSVNVVTILNRAFTILRPKVQVRWPGRRSYSGHSRFQHRGAQHLGRVEGRPRGRESSNREKKTQLTARVGKRQTRQIHRETQDSIAIPAR